MSALREFMAEKGKRETVKVSGLGKVKTAVQMAAIALLLLSSPISTPTSTTLVSRSTCLLSGIALLYTSAALAAVSGAQYLQASWATLSEGNEDASLISASL